MKGGSGRRAFVLAGGGSLGAVQVGMLGALVEAGVRADVVVGSSVGALNGAFYAFHPDSAGIRRLRSLWIDVSRGSVFPLSLWSTFQGLLGRKNGMVSQGGLEGRLASFGGGEPMVEVQIARIQVTCVYCERLFEPTDWASLNPVCLDCAASRPARPSAGSSGGSRSQAPGRRSGPR